MLTPTTVIGFVAAIASIAALIPQTIRIFRYNETENISIVTFIIVMVAMSLWITYGIIRMDWPLICSSIGLFMIASYTIYKIYRNQETQDENDTDVV